MAARIAIYAVGWLLTCAATGLAAEQCPPKNFPADTGFALATRGELKSLDPYALDEPFTLSMLGNVYEGLVKRDLTGKLVAGLADWETTDFITWRFHLRKDVKFQQGQDFTADDVVFSASRVRAKGSDLKSRLPPDAKIIKLDDYTVDFILPGANPLLHSEWDTWYILSHPLAGADNAEDPDNIDTAHSVAAARTNGTGPFSISDHKAGSLSVFVPNPYWWGVDKPNFDAVALCTIADDIDRVDLLLNKTVQLAEPILPADIQRVNAEPGVEVLTSSTDGLPPPEHLTIFLGFDTSSDQLKNSDADKNPFKDQRVRTAFYHAIDADSIRNVIMRNVAVLAASVVSPLVSAPAGTIARRPYDIKKARELLAEAGYPDGFTLEMDCPTGFYINDEEICGAVRDMLLGIGVEVTVKAQSKAKFLAKVLAYDSSFFLFGWAPESFDVWNVLNNLAACRDPAKQTGRLNIGGFCDPDLDTLIAKIRLETDAVARDGLVADALGRIHGQTAYIPLHQQSLIWGVSKKFDGPQRKNNRVFFNEFTRRKKM